jgi:hypothetical protein
LAIVQEAWFTLLYESSDRNLVFYKN